MPVNYPQAVDQIAAIFREYWIAQTPAVTTYVPEILWQANELRDKPSINYPSRCWARHSIQTVDERQTTFKDNCKRFTVSGLVFIQIFAPSSEAKFSETLRKLAMIAKLSMRGKSTVGGIVFHNVRINELPPEAKFFKSNVIAEFKFDEISE